jgi:hypothetical protein
MNQSSPPFIIIFHNPDANYTSTRDTITALMILIENRVMLEDTKEWVGTDDYSEFRVSLYALSVTAWPRGIS